jgi:3-phosphoshikimate 1-carboxyvinyltransferase
MIAAALLPGSDLFLPGVGLNPGRRLIVDVLQAMGADITIDNVRELSNEPVGDIRIKHSPVLNGVTISGAQVPLGIDEIPALALLGCFCQGTLSVQDASELRHKESDRLHGVVTNLAAAGAVIQNRKDGFDIAGTGYLTGGNPWISSGDHRLAMTGLVANLLSHKPLHVDDEECIKISYPSFQEDLASVLS